MLISKTPIHTYNMGVAMSAGLLIYLAGSTRFCTKRSRALIHSGSGAVEGTYEQMQSNQKDYEKLIKMMRELILERTVIPSQKYNRNKSKDWYIDSKEQVELGISHGILGSLDGLLE